MNLYKSLLFMLAGFISSPSFAVVYDIVNFGAIGDSNAVNTMAIQKAIDACHLAGGGMVLVPSGRFVTGSIELKSNIELHLAQGARLIGSASIAHYPAYNNTFQYWRGGENHHDRSLIYAINAKHIAITGFGTINGNGTSPDFRVRKDTVPSRPVTIRFLGCKNIRIDGITLVSSASWMQHYHDCEQITIRGIRVYNFGNKNNDGIDLDGCRNVTLSDCHIDAEDDAICLKALAPGKNCENISITNCVVSSTCNAIKMGTETSGGFKNILIGHCLVKIPPRKTVLYDRQYALSGIALEIVDGGTMDGISVSNITMEGIATPIFIRLGNRARKHWPDAPEPGVGSMRNIDISHITAHTHPLRMEASMISGIPDHLIENLSMSHIKIISRAGGKKDNYTIQIPELESNYPESKMFGKIPCYGMYFRHVKSLTLNRMEFLSDSVEYRGAMVLDQVIDFAVTDTRCYMNKESQEPALKLINCQSGEVEQFHPMPALPVVYQIAGAQTKQLTILPNLKEKRSGIFNIAPEVSTKDVTIVK